MDAVRTVEAESVAVLTVAGAAQNIPLEGRPCMLVNTGAQPLYIKPDGVATAANGFLVPAGTMFPIKFTVSPGINNGNLSVISNATGTTVAVMYFDM